jgi:ATP-binding cassette subfamily B multidrug efflux pump
LTSTHLIRPYLTENRLTIAVGLLSLIIVDVLQLLIPWVIKRAVDDLTLGSADPRGLLRQALAIAGLALVIGVFRYVWRRCLLGTSRRVEEGLRNRLFAHLQTLAPAYFDATRTGDLMAHATNDITQVRMATGMGLVALNDAVVLGTAAIGFMAVINLRLTLLVLIPAPLIILGTRFFSRQMHARYQLVQAAFGDLTEAVRERLAGVRIIKAQNWEAAASRAVAAASQDYVGRNLELVRITGAFLPMMLMFTNLSLAIVLYFGGRQAILAVITPGDLAAFINYLGLLTWPMMAMGWVTNLIQRGRASLDRLERILQTPAAIADAPEALPLEAPRPSLAFRGVRFAYGPPPAPPVLTDIRLTIPFGETLGIVGPPGSGKTTLLRLIPRLYEVRGGRLEVGGRDVRALTLASLRARVAFMPQEPFLFAATIRENITLGRGVSEARLEAVLEEAALGRTLQALPRGLETLVGEKGVILSGGQKQRIALARALLVEAPLLLLDDPVSQVDSATAEVIVAALERAKGGRSMVIASHRLAALRLADRIVTLEGGCLRECGTHDELLRAGGYYAEAYRRQALEGELDAA